MPIYEYACDACGQHHEIMQKISDQPLTHCPSCGGTMRKMISNTSFVLKGSGWYKTDYAADRKKGKDTKPGGEKTSETKPGTADAAQAGNKTEKKEPAASKA